MTPLLLREMVPLVLVSGLVLLAWVVMRAASAHSGKPLAVSREWLSDEETGRHGH